MSFALGGGPVRWRIGGPWLVIAVAAWAAGCAGPRATSRRADRSAPPPSRAPSGSSKLAEARQVPGEDPALAGFRKHAEAMGVIYTAPPGYTPTPVIDDHDVTYDYALLRRDKRVEIRFALRPYTRKTPQLVRTVKGAWAFFETGIMNLTHLGTTGEAGRAKALHAGSYGADVAKIVLVRWAESDNRATYFGNGYKFAVVIFLHRNDVGDVYEFFLLRDRDAAEQLSEKLLHTLRFTDER